MDKRLKRWQREPPTETSLTSWRPTLRPRPPLTSSDPSSQRLLLATLISSFCHFFAFHQEKNGAIRNIHVFLTVAIFIFPSTSLPTCPVCVRRYAASATLSIKGTSQIDDETVSLWWTRRYRGGEEGAVMDGLCAVWKKSWKSSSSKYKHMIYLSDIQDEI